MNSNKLDCDINSNSTELVKLVVKDYAKGHQGAAVTFKASSWCATCAVMRRTFSLERYGFSDDQDIPLPFDLLVLVVIDAILPFADSMEEPSP
jgi:hypothetical protein